MKLNTVYDCNIIELDKHHSDRKGNISVVENQHTIPFDVKRSFILNRPYQALYVKPGIWRDLDDFSSGAVCLVLASEKYDAQDYMRDYNEFLEFRKNG